MEFKGSKKPSFASTHGSAFILGPGGSAETKCEMSKVRPKTIKTRGAEEAYVLSVLPELVKLVEEYR